eukprot:XP_011664280.1 PREDICTED: major vault protein-like [Strongylocentrotus purpuratus]
MLLFMDDHLHWAEYHCEPQNTEPGIHWHRCCFARGNEESAIFSVPDFIGFACREVGSRIRAVVSRVKFDEFHRHSMHLLKAGVFGYNPDGSVKERLVFEANKLIATQSVQRTAGQNAACKEQEAKGLLERQKLANEQENEKARTILHELRASASAVESCGQATAEAQAQAERLLIEGHSAIEAARLKAEAEDILCGTDLNNTQMAQESELNYVREQNELEIDKTKQLADIEIQAELLSSLGLEMTLFTDGSSPINLFNVAEGLVAQPKKSETA